MGLFSVRNGMSDEQMFAKARVRDDVAAYSAYLARGQAHREVVEKELLPRAKLRLAIAEGGVDAIDSFMSDNKGTKIQNEIDIARRNALIAEFEKVRKKGTLAALLDYAARPPGSRDGQALQTGSSRPVSDRGAALRQASSTGERAPGNSAKS